MKWIYLIIMYSKVSALAPPPPQLILGIMWLACPTSTDPIISAEFDVD